MATSLRVTWGIGDTTSRVSDIKPRAQKLERWIWSNAALVVGAALSPRRSRLDDQSSSKRATHLSRGELWKVAENVCCQPAMVMDHYRTQWKARPFDDRTTAADTSLLFNVRMSTLLRHLS